VNSRYWAGKSEDKLNVLEDQMDSVIDDGEDVAPSDVRVSIQDIHDSYAKYRKFVQNVPNDSDRKKLLKGTLEAFKLLLSSTKSYVSQGKPVPNLDALGALDITDADRE